MTTHLKPTRLRAFQVTRESIKGELPGWVFGQFYHNDECFSWAGDPIIREMAYGAYLVAPWPDQPDRIEVWTPEQFAARTGGCPYEECAELLEGDSIYHRAKSSFDALHKGMMQEPAYDASAKGGLYWSQPFSFAEAANAIRQLAKEGGAHE